MDAIDRRKKENFMKYMLANPFYFKNIFPAMTLEQAWKYVTENNFRLQDSLLAVLNDKEE